MLKRVVKLGGSLLRWPPVFERVSQWFSRQSPAINLIVVGGGGAVDWWREMDLAHDCPPAWLHDRAITAMTENGRLVHQHLAGSVWFESWDEDRLNHSKPEMAVLDVRCALQQLEQRSIQPPLPRAWSVSADSIAAWLAAAWGADQLVLLKSCDAPPSHDQWRSEGFVDPAFDDWALPADRVTAVNLRSAAENG